MLYLSGSLPAKPEVRAMFDALPTGLMGNPGVGYDYSAGRVWAADNGCFNANWEPVRWVRWLQKFAHAAGSCLFAVVPDVVGDHAATLALWPKWSPMIRTMGYPVAFVCQNGCDVDDVPWDECDAVFIGGDDVYKLGPEAHRIVAEANRLGKWAHMGRVNSYRRLRIANDMGCDSVDGTFVAFGPDVNVPRIASWFQRLNAQPTLWRVRP